MFSIIAVFCEYADIHKLWDNHFESMVEDYRRNNRDESYIVQLVLWDVADIVRSMGKDIKDFGLPHLDESGTFFTTRVILVMIMNIENEAR
jgi:ATP-dependent DNA helicase PIF1